MYSEPIELARLVNVSVYRERSSLGIRGTDVKEVRPVHVGYPIIKVRSRGRAGIVDCEIILNMNDSPGTGRGCSVNSYCQLLSGCLCLGWYSHHDAKD